MESQVADVSVDIGIVVDLRVGCEVAEILAEPIEGIENV